MRISPNGFKCEIFAFSPAIFSEPNACLRLFYSRAKNFDPVISNSVSDRATLDFLLDLTHAAFSGSDANSEYSKIVISSSISSFSAYALSEILKLHPESIHDSAYIDTSAPLTVAQTVRYINENIDKEFDVSSLAKNVGLSRGYFSKIFLRYTGQSPAKFINRCRISNVLRLLSTMKVNVLDAAMMSGFSSASGFYKTFSNIYGTSPLKFISSQAHSSV